MPGAGHLFITYAKEDRTAARELCSALEGAGLTCWVSYRDIPAGVSRARAINDAIDSSRAMAVVVSSHTAGSKRLLKEIERARDRGLTLLGVRVEQVMPHGELERLLHTAEWIDAPAGATSGVVGRIAAAVIAARPAAAAPPAPEPEPEPEFEPEPEPAPPARPEPEPEPALSADSEPAPVITRELARPRTRPVPRPVAARADKPSHNHPLIMTIVGVAVTITLVAMVSSIYRGRSQGSEAVPAVTLPRITPSASRADAGTIVGALSTLEARAVSGSAPRAVRSAVEAASPPDRPITIETVRTLTFTDDGVEWSLHLLSAERLLVFTASSTNTIAYVAAIDPSNTQLDLRAALAGTPPSVPMRALDSASAATGWADTLARWAGYVREMRAS